MSTVQSLWLTSSEVLLSLSGLVLLLAAAWGGKASARLITLAAVAALAAATQMTLVVAGQGAGFAFDGLYSADAFSAFAKVLIYGASAIALLVSPRFFTANGGEYRAEYPVLVIFAAIGMGMMVSATNLLTLYVGLELNSLAAYVLASFIRTDVRSSEAGLKYFVLGALASGMLLFGISLVYGFTASTDFATIAKVLEGDVSSGVMIGIVLVLAGLAFKISAAPMHMWTPDVYEGAPTPVTAFFASAPKVASMALAIRVVIDAFGSQAAVWQQIVIFVALVSILWGAIAAVGQTNIKRLMAYS